MTYSSHGGYLFHHSASSSQGGQLYRPELDAEQEEAHNWKIAQALARKRTDELPPVDHQPGLSKCRLQLR